MQTKKVYLPNSGMLTLFALKPKAALYRDFPFFPIAEFSKWKYNI